MLVISTRRVAEAATSPAPGVAGYLGDGLVGEGERGPAVAGGNDARDVSPLGTESREAFLEEPGGGSGRVVAGVGHGGRHPLPGFGVKDHDLAGPGAEIDPTDEHPLTSTGIIPEATLTGKQKEGERWGQTRDVFCRECK